MQPLIRIQNVPISIEYKVQRAALQYQSKPASVNISRNRGSLDISRTPTQLQVDTHETRASAGLKSPKRTVEEFAERGKSAAREATRTASEDKNWLANNGASQTSLHDYAVMKNAPSMAQSALTFIPSVAPEVSFDPGSIAFDFTMDKLTFDWNINHKPQLEYVPGDIEFSVTQYPEVVIEYIGSPIYVPPSADPNYVPPSGIDANA